MESSDVYELKEDSIAAEDRKQLSVDENEDDEVNLIVSEALTVFKEWFYLDEVDQC